MSLPSNSPQLNALDAVRVSTEKQAQIGDSPEDQIEQNERYASLHDMLITKTLTYAESAAHDDYQPMQHVVDYAIDPKNKIDVVIIKSIDRFTRAGAPAYDILKRQLTAHGIRLADSEGVISTVEHNTLEYLGMEYDWSKHSPSRQAELMAAERAKDEVRVILTRMIGAEIRYTQLGYYQRAPLYGLEKVRVDTQHGKRSIMRLAQREGPIIERMYEMRAEGILSDAQICDEMNRMGFETPKRIKRDKIDRSRITGISGGKPMYPKLLRTYIKKTLYAGVNDEKWTAGKPVKCAFAPPIDVELWNKANRGKIRIDYTPEDPNVPIITRSAKQEKFVKKNVFNADFPYRKVVCCPECKHALLGSASRGRLGKYYPAYHCTNHGHYFRVPKKEFDAAIDSFIEHVSVRPERVDELMDAVMTIWQQKTGLQVEQKAQTVRRKSELEAEIQVIYERMKLVSNPVTIKLMEEDIVKLDKQASELDQTEQPEEDKKLVDLPMMLQFVKYFMEHLKELLIDYCNPVMRAHYFGVIFDQVPSFAEINDGSANISKIPGVNELFLAIHSPGGSLVRMRGLEPPRAEAH
jgi:DNA invertase Pin-like site-specific DNA recombinase